MEEDLRFNFIKDLEKSLHNLESLFDSKKTTRPKVSEDLFNSKIHSAEDIPETKILNPYNCQTQDTPEFKEKEREFLENFIENLLEAFPEDKKEIIRKEARKHL